MQAVAGPQSLLRRAPVPGINGAMHKTGAAMRGSGLGSVLFAAAAALVFATACSPSGQNASAPPSAPPILFQWEDYVDPPFLADYQKTHNEKPQTAIYADEDEGFAKMRAGYKPDVMGPCYYEFPRWHESWDILFDPKYKGRVAVLEGVDDTIPFIAHMIGVDPYNMSDADWQRVQAKLKQLVGQVRFVSSDDTSLAQGLASGELVAAMSWRVIYATLKSEGKPVAYMNPPGGMFTYVCGLVMHKEAKDYDKALALIDSSLSDEAAHYTIDHIGDGPANVQALEKEPDAEFEKIGIPRDVENFLKTGTFQQRLKDKEKIVNAWTEIRAGL